MKNSTKNITILLLTLFVAILSMAGLFLFKENAVLQKELIITRNELKQNSYDFTKKNKSLIKLSNDLQKKNDSLMGKNTTDYKIIDGIKIGNTPITLEQLITIANKNSNENILLRKKAYNDSLTLKNYTRILKKLEEEKVVSFKLNDKLEGEYSYMNMKNYEKNKEKRDSILNAKNSEISNIKNELIGKNSALNLIKKYYGIDSQIEIGAGKISTKLVNTEKIDSALWVYPYYKHKIKTNKKGETIIR